jgi:DNA-binding MarR family transcriptional regulator
VGSRSPSAPDADDIAAAWRRELPDAPTRSIAVVSAVKEIATRLRREREQELHRRGIDAATLDLVSTLRRAGAPYRLSTRELGERSLVTAGAITQRVSRAEREGLVTRRAGEGRAVLVELTPAGHELVESVVASVLAIDDERMPPLDPAELARFEEAVLRWRDALRE